MTEPRFHSEARSEFREAAQFYESQLAGLGAEFTSEVERTVGFVQSYPNAGSPLGTRLRRVVVRRFPFFVIYRLEGDTVFITAVAHQRRRPGYWRHRK